MAWSLGLLLLLAAGSSAEAQERRARVASEADAARYVEAGIQGTAPRITQVEATGGRVVYEVRADWSASLSEAVQLHRADPQQLVLSAVRGHATTSTPVRLAAMQTPSVEILAVDFDEVPFGAVSPLARQPEGAETAFEQLTRPVAEVASVGEERRQPMGTLVVRLLHVDAERQVVRRYRRLLVAVRTGLIVETLPGGERLLGGSSPHVDVTQSVLAEGTWFKIPITREGIYRIDQAYLQSLGVNVTGLNPNRLQVYGNGGGMLPAVNSAPRPADLVENAVFVSGAGDGSFDAGDALYFYAEAPSGWTWVPDSDPADTEEDGHWAHFINSFTTTSYVFLRVDGNNGTRVSGGGNFPGWADAARQGSVEGRLFVEEDRVNIERNGGGSGLDWMGPEVSPGSPSLTVLDTIPPGLQAGTARFQIRAGTRSNPAVTLAFTSRGQALGSVTPSTTTTGPTAALGHTRMLTAERATEAGGQLAVTMTMQGATGSAVGWIDWVEAIYPRAPRAYQGLLRFHTPGGQTGRFEFALAGFAVQPQVWDVTDPAAIRRLGVQAEGERWVVQVEALDESTPRELVAFETASARIEAPGEGTEVPNQNLHGLGGYPDYVVVTPAEFRPAAEELAAHRRTNDGLSTVVVDIEQLFNEFSGGKVDMRAVRDYMKFLYDRATTAGQLPRYLLLFGDGHYDYRALIAGGTENNWIPTYQTVESLNLMLSYTSDDYFGLLGDEEGDWTFPGHSGVSEERVDLGIGRLPLRSLEDANAVIEKLLHYEDPSTYGAWRTRYTFVADDAYPNNSDGSLHILNADAVAEQVRTTAEDLNIDKVYSAAYPAVITAVGRRIPEATADILRILEEGTLVWNYSGHGGPESLADERLITVEDIQNLDNFDRLSVFVTATCSFGRFDIIDRQSGAELLLLGERAGAVALFTTVRTVFTSASQTLYNFGLNLRLTEIMLERDAAGRPKRFGDIIRETKNTNEGAQGNNRKFNLLGDPAMRLGLPERPVSITSINGSPLEDGATAAGSGQPTRRAGAPVLRANEVARVEGEVFNFDGTPDPSFNGEVELVVFDAAREVQLDPTLYSSYNGGRYLIRNDRIYRGRASVRNGQFSAEFIVPRDVSYSGLAGRISAYVRSTTGLHGVGTTQSFTISPTAGAPLNDTEGPQIRAYLNDSTFVDGGLVGADPTLLVRLFDENGINTVGTGVGHELLVTFDDDPTTAVEVSRFYEGDLDSYQSGTVRFPLPEQAPGLHRVTVTAWDVANNSATAELSYLRGGAEELTLRNVYNYPNPTSGATRFIFEHNQPPGTVARIQLRLFTLSGRPVRTMAMDEVLTGGLVQIPFDGLDEDFDRLGSGVYLYRLRVTVDRPDGETAVAERIERLAVIR